MKQRTRTHDGWMLLLAILTSGMLLLPACGGSVESCSDDVCPKESNYCLQKGSSFTCLSHPDNCANAPSCDCNMREVRDEECPGGNLGCSNLDDGVILVTCE